MIQKLSILMLLSFWSFNSYALLMTVDYDVPRVDWMRDTDTGLEWLALTTTANLSVDNIINVVVSTWYQKYRYTTRYELNELANYNFRKSIAGIRRYT